MSTYAKPTHLIFGAETDTFVHLKNRPNHVTIEGFRNMFKAETPVNRTLSNSAGWFPPAEARENARTFLFIGYTYMYM